MEPPERLPQRIQHAAQIAHGVSRRGGLAGIAGDYRKVFRSENSRVANALKSAENAREVALAGAREHFVVAGAGGAATGRLADVANVHEEDPIGKLLDRDRRVIPEHVVNRVVVEVAISRARGRREKLGEAARPP